LRFLSSITVSAFLRHSSNIKESNETIERKSQDWCGSSLAKCLELPKRNPMRDQMVLFGNERKKKYKLAKEKHNVKIE